ncbi:MAG: HAD family hydrolase [Bacteroidales bacterium]|nr:HAD family hydrolase [Bacteroidales bacterium]
MKAIFWDIDNTLIDFVASSHEAFFELCKSHQLIVDEGHFQRWYTFKEQFWRKQEQGQMNVEEIVAHQFDQLRDETHFQGDIVAFSLEFQQLLHHHAVPVMHAKETLSWCQLQGFQQYAASNGYIQQQTSRLTLCGLFPYFNALFVSDDIKAEKPSPTFFQTALKYAHLNAEDVLMIGDNLITDIQGAQSVGIKACWYNTHTSINNSPKNIQPDYEIHTLKELETLAMCL